MGYVRGDCESNLSIYLLPTLRHLHNWLNIIYPKSSILLPVYLSILYDCRDIYRLVLVNIYNSLLRMPVQKYGEVEEEFITRHRLTPIVTSNTAKR
jgi:hypothetical protein